MIKAFEEYLSNHDITFKYINEDKSLLTFEIDSVHFLYNYSHDIDPTYIRLMIPNISTVDEGNADDVLKLFQLSQSYKVGKAVIVDGQLWLSADSFVYTSENIGLVFDRLLSVLKDMFNEYKKSKDGKE